MLYLAEATVCHLGAFARFVVLFQGHLYTVRSVDLGAPSESACDLP